MLKPVQGFMISLFNVFLVYIVLANFVGWSGAYVDLVGSSGYEFNDSYFGFESLTMLADDFSYRINYIQVGGRNLFNMNSFAYYLEKLVNVSFFGIPNVISKLENKSFLTALEGLTWFFTILFQPVIWSAYVILCVACILWWVLIGVLVMLSAFGGKYNIQFTNTDDVWNQWSYLDSEWNWDSIISYVRMNVRPLLHRVYGGARGDFTPFKIY